MREVLGWSVPVTARGDIVSYVFTQFHSSQVLGMEYANGIRRPQQNSLTATHRAG